MTPLLIAIQNTDTEIVHCLLRAGASVRDSPVALNAAIAVGQIDIVVLLMKYGANPALKNGAGRTSFELLQRPEQNDIEEVMRNTKEIEIPTFQKARLAFLGQPAATLGDLLDRLPPGPPRRTVAPYSVTRL
jgi:hypothetical protein